MTNNEANEKYLEYLEGHIGNVKEAFDILCKLDIPYINENKNELLSIVSSHDESKYEEPEWSAYLHHFYPTCDEDSLKTEEFEEACRCHIHNNPHHWDYWVEDGKLIDDIDEHEYKLYTVERLCDHMAMSIQNNNKPADWYYANKDHIIMPDYGYEFYEDMLAKIPEDYDLSFHGTRTDGKPERDMIKENLDLTKTTYTEEQRQNVIAKTKENMNNHRYAKYIDFVSLDILDDIKEYDREVKPGQSQESFEELFNAILVNGITEPGFIDYNPNNGHLKLAEGNHRLLVCKILKLDSMPVWCSRSNYMEDGIEYVNPENITPYCVGALGENIYADPMNPKYLGEPFGPNFDGNTYLETLTEDIGLNRDYIKKLGNRAKVGNNKSVVSISFKDAIKDEYVGGDGAYMIELNDGWYDPAGNNYIWAKNKREAHQILKQCTKNKDSLNEDSIDDYIKSLDIDKDGLINNYDNQIKQHYKYIRLVGRKINDAKYDYERNQLKKRQDFYKQVYNRLKDIKDNLNESELLEAKASQLRNKTKSEDPARVKKSRNVKTKYIGMSKFGVLNFKTTSESRNGYHYQTIEFQSLKPFEELIKKNGKIIPTDVEKAFNEQDINVYCSDESFTYWAWYHQAYQNDYAYIDDAIPDLGKRLQAPKVNNVRLAGALCKHLYSVLEYITRPFVLLAISDDMNNFLNQKSHKYAKQTVATQNWYDAVKQWTSEDALEYLGLTKEQIIMDLSKTLKVNPTTNLDDFVDDLVKDAILKRKDDIDPKLERDITNKVIDELDLDVEYENLKPEEVEHEEDIK